MTTGNTPASESNRPDEPTNAVLAGYINTDAVLIHGAYTAVPLSITGGSSDSSFFWNRFSTPVDERARHDFAGQTCNGCHFSEVNNPQTGTPLNTGGFYQIAPINDASPDGTARLSPFIKDFEIPRRTSSCRTC